MAARALQFVSKATVKLAVLEPSSVMAKEFVSMAQSPKVRKTCPGLDLRVQVLDPVKISPDSFETDSCRSSVHLTFADKSEKTFDTSWTMIEVLNDCASHADENEITPIKG